MEKESLIIIGAGIAGLTAAAELAPLYNVTILEASERVGGRIHSDIDAVPRIVVEHGAEFIHGNLPETMRLVKEAGLTVVPVKGKLYRKEDGEWKTEEEMTDHWDLLLKKMSQLKTDLPLLDFLEIHFPGDQYRALRQQAISYAGGFDLADEKNASTRSLYAEWSNEDEQNFRITAGYSALTEHLYNKCLNLGCTIFFNKVVRQVDWETGDVVVYTSGQDVYRGERVIITVPVGVLQQVLGSASINFTPELDIYVRAARDIGMGKVIRYVIGLDKVLWQPDTGFIFSEEQVPTWWTSMDADLPVLTGWVGGNKAEALAGKNSEELIDIAYVSLASIFDMPVDQLKGMVTYHSVTDWSVSPWSFGGYTYKMPESPQALRLMNEPVADTVYFCGEGYYMGNHPGTVEAAIVHAMQTARLLQRKRT